MNLLMMNREELTTFLQVLRPHNYHNPDMPWLAQVTEAVEGAHRDGKGFLNIRSGMRAELGTYLKDAPARPALFSVVLK